MGSSSWIANNIIAAPIGNRDLVLNMMNWLTSDEDLISIRPKEPEDRRLHVTGIGHARPVPDQRDLSADDRDLPPAFQSGGSGDSSAMKFGGLFTAVGVLVVLGGLVWWFEQTSHHGHGIEDSPGAETDLGGRQTDRRHPARQTRFRSRSNSPNWPGPGKITKPTAMPADQDAVTMLTTSLATLNADRLIDEHPSSLSDFGLTNPLEEVDLTLKGGKTRSC